MAINILKGNPNGKSGSHEQKGCFSSVEGAPQSKLEQSCQDGGGLGSHSAPEQEKVALGGSDTLTHQMRYCNGDDHDLRHQL